MTIQHPHAQVVLWISQVCVLLCCSWHMIAAPKQESPVCKSVKHTSAVALRSATQVATQLSSDVNVCKFTLTVTLCLQLKR
jgi:hypothetical protein